MENKKDLGSLFKKRLEGAEVEPSNTLWHSIESTLNEKQKRRGGFLLFWSGLVTVLLLLGISYILFGDIFFENNTNSIESPITEIDSSNKNRNQRKDKIDSKDILEIKDISTTDTNKITNNNSTTNSIDTSVPVENKTKNYKSTSAGKDSKRQRTNTLSQVNSSLNKNINSNENNGVNLKDNNISLFKNSEKRAIQNFESLIKLKKEKSSDNTKILEKTDSTLIKSKPTTKKKKKETEVELKKKKQDDKQEWLISVHASPTAFGYLSDRSPYNKSLSNGRLRSGSSYAYSALLNIPLNNKLTFRLGFRNTKLKFKVKQATAEISNNGSSTILNSEAINRNGITLSSEFVESLNAPNTFQIDQEVSYQGVPFQFLYQIKDSKVKIDAIIGVSAMFLKKNSTLFSSVLDTQKVGSGAFLKKAAISSSIGLGFRYQLSPRIRLDLEPIFQYQFNANETGFGKLKPFILNLNAGATLKL